MAITKIAEHRSEIMESERSYNSYHAATPAVTIMDFCTEEGNEISKIFYSYSYEPCTQMKDWISIMSRGLRSARSV